MTSSEILLQIKKNLTFFDVSFLYIYLSLIITRIIDLPEIIKAFLALPLFFLLPFLTGTIMTALFKKVFRNEHYMLPVKHLNYFILCLITGIFSLEFTAVVLQIIGLSLLLKNFSYLSLAVVTLGYFYLRLVKHNNKNYEWAKKQPNKHVLPVLLLTGLSIIPFLIKVSFVQPPLTTWDSWANPIPHVQTVLRMLNQGFFDLTQRWMEILLTAISCQLLNVTRPEFFSYVGTLLVTAMLAIGTYVLTYRFSSKISMSLLSGFFSIFLNAPISFHEIPIYHFKSNTLLIGLYPWIVLLIIDLWETRTNKELKNIIILTTPVVIWFSGLIILSGSSATNALYSFGFTYEIQRVIIRPICIIIPALAFALYALMRNRLTDMAILILATTVLYTTNESDFVVYFSSIIFLIFAFNMINGKGKGRMAVRVLSLLFFIIVYLAWNEFVTLPDVFLSSIIGYDVPTLDVNVFLVKKMVFSDGNSLIIRYFLGFGLITLLLSEKKKHLLALAALTITLFLYFFPDFWTLRGLGATTPFIAFAISNSFYTILGTVDFSFALHKKTKILAKYIFTFLFISIIVPSLLTPIYTKLSRFPGSRLAPYEYEIAVWLRENTKETEVIISDYWTMMLLNPIANKVWWTDRQFMAESLDPEYKLLLEEIRNYLFKAPTSLEAYEEIRSIAAKIKNGIDWTERYYCECTKIRADDLSFIIILSPRTIAWLETGNMDLMEPQNLKVDSYLAIFNNTKYFEPLTAISGEIYVFKVRQ